MYVETFCRQNYNIGFKKNQIFFKKTDEKSLKIVFINLTPDWIFSDVFSKNSVRAQMASTRLRRYR
jgi:hypothetical protein